MKLTAQNYLLNTEKQNFGVVNLFRKYFIYSPTDSVN